MGTLWFLSLALRIGPIAAGGLCPATWAFPQARQFGFHGKGDLEVVAIGAVETDFLPLSHLDALFVLKALGPQSHASQSPISHDMLLSLTMSVIGTVPSPSWQRTTLHGRRPLTLEPHDTGA